MIAIFDPQQFFDKIFCISVDSRLDRQKAAKEAFAKLGILQRVEFVLVEKHPTNPEEGIFDSHLQCLRRGVEEGGNHILIFEDDIIIANFQEQRTTEAIQQLQQEENWDAFFLGAISSGSRKTASKYLAAIDYRCLTHGYAVNRPFAQKIVEEQWDGVAYDGFLKKRCTNSFAPVPMIAFQSTSISDNKTIVIDRMRRFFGGLKFLQRSNELLQRYKLSIIIVHLLVLMAAFLVLIQ
jgi:glycosyl transferase, family 25